MRILTGNCQLTAIACLANIRLGESIGTSQSRKSSTAITRIYQKMLPYLLTTIAGIALGIVGMRLWQTHETGSANVTEGSAPSKGDKGVVEAEGMAQFRNRRILAGAGILGLAALVVLAFRPAGQAPAAPGEPGGSAMPAVTGEKQLDDVDTMISRLAARLEKEPNDGEGFRMLGWSYVMTGHPDRAIEPYRRAISLLPKSAAAHAGLGEALTAVAGNKVTPEAKSEFDKALALEPAEPRARHFTALWLAQNGRERDALDKWIALANSASADSPWQPEVRKQIDAVANKLGVDVSGKLKGAPAASNAIGPDAAAVEAAGQLPESQRQAMIDGMVEGLANKLKANPKDVEGWVKLLRSRMVLKQPQKAAEDLAIARRALAGEPAALSRLNAAAAEFGVPGAR